MVSRFLITHVYLPLNNFKITCDIILFTFYTFPVDELLLALRNFMFNFLEDIFDKNLEIFLQIFKKISRCYKIPAAVQILIRIYQLHQPALTGEHTGSG